MRRRPWLWFCVSMLCFVGAVYFWRRGDEWAARKAATPNPASTNQAKPDAPKPRAQAAGFSLLSQPGTGGIPSLSQRTNSSAITNRLAYRLSNTTKTVGQLGRSEHAVILENALFDTSEPTSLPIPDHLRSQGDPGSYLVQARDSADAAFRSRLERAGATLVSYIPNNAWLVRLSAAGVQQLASDVGIQSILPYEPYYKLKSSLLPLAVEQQPLPPGAEINLLMFPGAREQTLTELNQLGAKVLSEDRSPFGPVVKILPLGDSLPALAGLPGVQEIELAHVRAPANDLSRARMHVAVDPITSSNYLGLTGTNILINVNDTGVDANHPDLAGRVLFDEPIDGIDTNGHGTHVAGIIASSGLNSPSVTNASSQFGLYAGTNISFRGVAPGATLFSMAADPRYGPSYSDTYLQETAARTNAFISNNSWNYAATPMFKPSVASYDLAAASYDAAVRDALPRVPGPQPLLFVFAAGDAGAGSDNGTEGLADTILSPATAKNVITVGAVEQPRFITNTAAYDVGNSLTGQVYFTQTDSSNEVASFSSRGNVGVGIEGDFGRFKPDVVAPGTFVISTKPVSAGSPWDQTGYYTYNFRYYTPPEIFLNPRRIYAFGITIPTNCVRVDIRWLGRSSPSPFPDEPIFVSTSGAPLPAFDFVGTNSLSINNPSQGDWLVSIANVATQQVAMDISVDVKYVDPNDLTLSTLSNLNNSLGPNYRYESGTSMSAAAASGTLALMQQFLQQIGRTNGAGGVFGRSPALMKAMLINGARSMDPGYNLQTTAPLNFQGWGLVQLPSSLPGGLAQQNPRTNSMWLLDQDPTNALATGQSYTFQVGVDPGAQALPLRITLAWSDPPGNPVAGIKLVNDLDLLVTNLDSVGSGFDEIYFGNDIPSGSDFSLPWDTNTVPNVDFVNNVENIYIPPPLSTNYSITVRGHRVNVNAVPENPNNVVQDFALVVSCGDGQVTNAISFTKTAAATDNTPLITTITNQYVSSSNYFGGVLQNQRVSANTPLIGTNTLLMSDQTPMSPDYNNGFLTLGVTNQWHFYAINFTPNYTNYRFAVLNAVNLSVPRMGADALIATNATRQQADVDFYVSQDTNLILLDPLVLSNSYKQIGRDGSQTLLLTTNSNGYYFIAVKSEDQMAAQYILLAQSSLLPFNQDNGHGSVMPWYDPFYIPDGSAVTPGITNVFIGPGDPSVLVRRIIVSNLITHENLGDLIGNLAYSDGTFAVLNNHKDDGPLVDHWYIYDDSGEGDVPNSIHTDGPGTLQTFAGKYLGQMFNFFEEDNQLGHIGTNLQVVVFAEKQLPLTAGILVTIQPGHCINEYIDVPPQATGMTITATLRSGTGPVSMQVCQNSPGGLCSTNIADIGAGASITLDQFSDPPLTPGIWYVRLCNNGTDPVTVFVIATLDIAFRPFRTMSYTTNPVAPILDDAVTDFAISVTNHFRIAGLDVGLLLSDPRVSDLAITLISPTGQRFLLSENRGALSTNGLGTFSTLTNGAGIEGFAWTNWLPIYTNNFDDVAVGAYAPGATFDGWNVLSNYAVVYPELPAPWLSNNVLVLGEGIVSNTLPTTNSTYYALSFEVTHAPYIVGTIGWWPFDGSGADIFGGFNGLLFGDVSFNSNTGMVSRAYFGDGIATRMMVPRAPALDVSQRYGFTIEGWINPANITNRAPLVEWFDPLTTNGVQQGVQFWLSGVPGAPDGPGALFANFWDTNSQPHVIATTNLVITNGGWQHIALTYDASTRSARLYTNGFIVASQVVSPTNFGLRSAGDLYFGYDPTKVPTPISYPNFSTPTNLTLIGNATAPSGILRLTPSAEGQRGNAWSQSKLPVAAGFDTQFQLQFTAQGALPGTPLGADGVTFTVQNNGPADPTFYANGGNGANHVSVFFNTFLNWPGCNDYTNCDVSDNSVGIVTNNSYAAQADLTPLGINLKDGRVHQARVVFDGNSLSVVVDNQTVLAGIRIPAMAPATDAFGRAWVGFSAGTGAAWENQDVLSWTMGGASPATDYQGGLDEFGLYDRPLSDLEIGAIFRAGSAGKYGTNVLWTPVTNSVQLTTSLGSYYYTFTNGVYWTNGGPQWETNVIIFTNTLNSATTNGPATNFVSIILTNLEPNATFDNFVLYSMVTNFADGLMHFSDDTNTALLPIKFAGTPYSISNSAPTLIYSNDFELATQQIYAVGAILPGDTNDPALGPRNWTVVSNSISVISNSLVDEATGTNCVALALGGLQALLPTVPDHKYQLTYSVRGPAAVSWWTGDINPLDNRAWDLLGGNDGAFFFDATNSAPGLYLPVVGQNLLFFPGEYASNYPDILDPYFPDADVDDPASVAELGDPANLRLTNAFTIEGWINPGFPMPPGGPGEVMCPTMMVLFRGYPDLFDCNSLGDPYYVSLEPHDNTSWDLHFHISDSHNSFGADVITTNGPIQVGAGPRNDGWYHIAAVFEKPFTNFTYLVGTNVITVVSNSMRLYADSVCVATNYTRLSPYGDLDPSLSGAVAIGNRPRHDQRQPFIGAMDELTVYGRNLTEPEISAIYGRRGLGKADFKAPSPGASLAKINVTIDGIQRDLAYGENSKWTTRTITFTAQHTNSVLVLQSLLPGTIIDGITLTEVPNELTYQPEVTFAPLLGQDAFGTWQLEVWDNRAGPSALSNLVQLLSWQLNFQLLPTTVPPVIELTHGILYTNSLLPGAVQDFVVNVPQWALFTTNLLQYAVQYNTTNLVAVGVMYDTNGFPTSATNGIMWPPVTNGTVVLTTNSATSSPWFYPGQTYYLAVTNTNTVSVTFAIGVLFDITSLTNCQPLSNFVWQAGIPRYFQIDVTNDTPPGVPAQELSFWLTGAGAPTNYLGLRSNVTIVASSHLPLPDLTHFDYVSFLPFTNNDGALVVTNTTPYPIQTNRWYIGVFSDSPTNIPFTIQACYSTNVPLIIDLTNGVPFVVSTVTNRFAAPPGPPQSIFFRLTVTNFANAVMFEMYNLSGDADLVLQRSDLPLMAPYFDSSAQRGRAPEQIVVRSGPRIADLRGDWLMGVFNNEITNVAYTIRAVTQNNGMLLSAQPLRTTLGPLGPPHNDLLLQWNSIIGEWYSIEFTTNLLSPNWQVLPNGLMRATTVLSTFEVPIPSGGIGFYRIRQVSTFNAPTPPLRIQLWTNNQVRISWSTNWPNETLQYSASFSGPWANLNLPVTIEGSSYVVYDTIGSLPRYYRLIP